LIKEGKNMLGLPIKHNLCHFSASLDAYNFLEFVPTVQLILYMYPAFVPFGKYFTRHFQQYFKYIMATSFSGGRSRSTWREPLTMGKQLVNITTCGCESSAPFW
jgi:hypothetical protein